MYPSRGILISSLYPSVNDRCFFSRLNKMQLEDFFPKYPNIHKDSFSLYNPYGDQEFRDVITSKKEFADLKLPRVEAVPEKPGEMFNHQKIIARFLSSHSPYNELLLYHEMGTGKTCTAIACIEQLRSEKGRTIKGAMVFARGGGLIKNFVDELLFKCTDGRYIPENYKFLSDLKKAHRVRKITSEFYTFETFEKFAKHLKQMSDSQIRTSYSNHVIVIDEVHNIRLKTDKTPEELDIYNQFNRFLHVIENRKILLMSGTPIKDQPAEIANVMNLILPKDMQFNPDTFVRDYFDGATLKRSMYNDFVTKISGRISYLKSMTSDVKKVFMGEKMGQLQHFKVWTTAMDPFQEKVYLEAYARDKTDRSISNNSRQASLFVFPNGTYGNAGSTKYITQKTARAVVSKTKTRYYSMNPELVGAINKDVNNLRRYSCKYADLIENILPSGRKTFVYCEYVDGSGAILLGLILQQFGYSLSTGKDTTPGKRYALATAQTSSPREIKRTIDLFNSIGNKEGDIVSVIIGSRVIAEGYTLNGITTEVILTPHWNFSETAQAIARGWRIGSHSTTPDVTRVEVYQTVAMPSEGKSIDLEMYELSERKDIQIKAIEHAIKISAFDCSLNRDRNFISGYDDMRECDYADCDYQCLAKPYPVKDLITFNMYYANNLPLAEYLKTYFKTEYFISIKDLEQTFPESTFMEIVKTVKELVESDTIVFDRYNIPHYIRMDRDVVFTTLDPSRKADYYTMFYAKNIIVDAGKSFSQILKGLVEDNISTKLEKLFLYPEYINVILPSLSPEIQTIILQGCIEAEDKALDVNVEAREAILTYFRGSYMEDADQWVIMSPHVCLQKGTSTWSNCTQEAPVVRKDLLKSPIGYYGMYNPRLADAFCIKEIQDEVDDLRKVKVGKRCGDYDKKVLTDIIARRIKKLPPPEFLQDTPRDELIDIAKGIPGLTAQDFGGSRDALRRAIYWSRQLRSFTCANIRQWMEDNNLVEENINCGHQKKKRGLAA